MAHGKWMVSDTSLFVGTSNWVGDYFTTTCGVSLSATGNPMLLNSATDTFMRDWSSKYSVPLPTPPS